MKKKQIVKSFLSFSSEKESEREKVASQAETANNEHQDSLHQECEHHRPILEVKILCSFYVSDHYIIFLLSLDGEDVFRGLEITER